MTLPPVFRRGDIHYIDFTSEGETEANGRHPAIIITNNSIAASCPAVMVIPLTTEITRVYKFQQVLPNNRTELPQDSKAQIELLTCVGKWRIEERRAGYVPEDLMKIIEEKMIEHLGITHYLIE